MASTKIDSDVFDTTRRDEYRVAMRHLLWFLLRHEGHSWKEIAWETMGTHHHSPVHVAVNKMDATGHEEEIEALLRLEPPRRSLLELYRDLRSR